MVITLLLQDLLMDTLGAGIAGVVAATGTEDLFGFRHGILIPAAGAATCCRVPGKGPDDRWRGPDNGHRFRSR